MDRTEQLLRDVQRVMHIADAMRLFTPDLPPSDRDIHRDYISEMETALCEMQDRLEAKP